MRFHWAAAVLVTLLAVPAALAQGQQPPAGADPQAASVGVKIGVLDVREAIVSSAEGKRASAELQSRFSARQSEMENSRKRIEDLQNRLRTGGQTLSDEERFRLQREIQQLTRQYQRMEEDLREDVGFAENEIVEQIGRKMREVVDRYARENAFAIILDVSGQGSVVYASNQVDITADIIRLYDQANPVGGSAQPAQPRPQPGQARPPQQQPPQRPPQR